MADVQNGKTDKPRNPDNVKRPYSEGFSCIDFSLDAKGQKRTTHANTLAYGDDDKAPLMQPVALDE